MFKLMGKKIFTNFRLKNLLNWPYVNHCHFQWKPVACLMLYLQVYRFDFKPAVYITMTTVEEKKSCSENIGCLPNNAIFQNATVHINVL